MRREQLTIRKPCQADWERMRRLEQKRYCDACNKHVHDLSTMTENEARALLAAPPTEGLCVRYLHDETGHVVFRPERLLPRAGLLRAKRIAAAAAAAVLPFGLAACGGATMGEPQPMMGDIAPTVQPPPDPSVKVHPELPQVEQGPHHNEGQQNERPTGQPQGCPLRQHPR